MKEIAEFVIPWLEEAASVLREKMLEPLEVETKSGRNDLVTNLDKATQAFLVGKIQEHFPEDDILGEESGFNQEVDWQKRVWIIDPIDGTLNFVLQKQNFCIMLALYEKRQSRLGFIYDVIAGKLYWGGRDLGVYCNQEKLRPPKAMRLADGLLGMNAYLYAHNLCNAQAVGDATAGVRIMGCAGLEMIAILTGQQVGYLSNLQPWDYAPGCALLDAFGIPYTGADKAPLNFSGRQPFIALSQPAFAEFQKSF